MSDQTDNQATVDIEGDFEDRINDLVFRIEESSKLTKNIANELKTLKKEHTKIVKKIAGSRRKKAAKDPNAPKKAPSGFAKPTKISAELANFLGVSEGEMIARPDVTKGITKYVKEHNLQKEENKRVIDLTKPGGQALIDLLNIPKGEELTFFNLQKYLKIHFPVSEKTEKSKKSSETAETGESKKRPTKKVSEEKSETKVKSSKSESKSEHVNAEKVPVEETKVRSRRRRTEEVA